MLVDQIPTRCQHWAVRRVVSTLLSLGLVAAIGCENSGSLPPRMAKTIGTMITYVDHHQPIEPLPDDIRLLNDKSRLGKLLFHDNRLSHDNTISCASCHDIANGGDDGRAFSLGIDGAVGSRNAPTVLNAALNLAQFWDGRASSLEAQVAGPIHAANEMGSNWDEVIAKLSGDTDLKARFEGMFPDGITANSITECIASFEELLITPHAPFDEYLRGNTTTVSLEAIQGYHLFRDLGCAACHQGQGIGGNLFQQFGVMKDFFESSRESPDRENSKVRSTASNIPTDNRRFKVPTLRNIALTGPYLHDGSAETLEEAVEVMSMYQLGADLSPEDIRLLVAFLNSLTGVLSEELK